MNEERKRVDVPATVIRFEDGELIVKYDVPQEFHMIDGSNIILFAGSVFTNDPQLTCLKKGARVKCTLRNTEWDEDEPLEDVRSLPSS